MTFIRVCLDETKTNFNTKKSTGKSADKDRHLVYEYLDICEVNILLLHVSLFCILKYKLRKAYPSAISRKCAMQRVR